MLARLLHPLDKRQQTLLLSMMTMAPTQAMDDLRFLPEEEAVVFREKMEQLAEIPSDKRVPLMVRQLKQLLAFRHRTGLEGVEPSWLIAGLKGESPRTVAIVLLHMPSSVSRQIIARLPAPVREAMPERAELFKLPLELIKLVRSRFDAKFASMPSDRELDALRFVDLVIVSAPDLLTLIRKLGSQELASAFVAVGKRALAEFLRRLPPDSAEEVLAAVKRLDPEDEMDLKSAQTFIAKVLGNFANTDELFQKAGLFRLARALDGLDALLIRQVSQRFPRAHGRLLAEYLRKAAQLRPEDPAVQAALRDQTLDVLVDLSRRGKIDARYATAPTVYETR